MPAVQRVPPVRAPRRAGARRGRRTGEVHELERTDLHRFRRIPGAFARRGLQEDARHGRDRHEVGRRDRGRQGAARVRGRGRCDVQVAAQRLAAPVLRRNLHGHPAQDRRRHHVRFRRADHADEHPRLPGTFRGTHLPLGATLRGRAQAAHRRASWQAVSGAVRRGAGRELRGSAPACGRADRLARFRRRRHRRCDRKAHHRRHLRLDL